MKGSCHPCRVVYTDNDIIGSVAAWAQRIFSGGNIPAGSWFSMLQKFGMTLARSWLSRLVELVFSWLSKLAALVGSKALLGIAGI